MIAKIVPRKARHGGSPRGLLEYIERDGVKGGERLEASFDAVGNLVAYMARDRDSAHAIDRAFGDVRHYLSRAPIADPGTGEVTIAEYPIETQGVYSLESAAAEFRAVASESRATNPYLHVVVSWRDGEAPANAEAFAAGRRVLTAPGDGRAPIRHRHPSGHAERSRAYRGEPGPSGDGSSSKTLDELRED